MFGSPEPVGGRKTVCRFRVRLLPECEMLLPVPTIWQLELTRSPGVPEGDSRDMEPKELEEDPVTTSYDSAPVDAAAIQLWY